MPPNAEYVGRYLFRPEDCPNRNHPASVYTTKRCGLCGFKCDEASPIGS